MLAVMIGARSAKRSDVADHVVDLRARQREIRHRTVRMRQERAKLIGCDYVARDSSEARRALWNGAGVTVAEHVAIGAPLPRDLRAFVDVGAGGMRSDDRKDEQRQHRGQILITHSLLLAVFVLPGLALVKPEQ
jgi:hypothetical protein